MLLQFGMKRESVICLDMLLIHYVFFFNSVGQVYGAYVYNTCHMDLLWLIAVTGANVSFLFAVTCLLCLLSQLSFYM